MSLKGNLQSVDLGNILQMLSINQKEGTLVLFDGDTKKSIYFSRDGVSMLSRGRRGNDSLGRVLLRYGRITPDQLAQALEVQEREGKRLGTVLEELGLASHDDIENAVRTQIEEEIYNLFIWENASFEFIEGPPPPALENIAARVTFNVNSLILEAQRRHDEWNYIRGLVPSLDEIYRPTASFAEADIEDPVFHLPFAPNVLENLNQGRLNVSELIEASYAGKFEVCKMLANLLEQGAVEPLPMSDLSALAAEATSRGDHPQAAKFLLRIVELGGATPQVNLSLGYALEAVEEPERASHYLKAAAEAYADMMQAQPAFDAYLRVARSLPTDLGAITRLVEIACDHPPVMEAHRHEVVQSGRRLADCLKEIGKTAAAMKVLHRLAQANANDMALRGQLASLYVEAGMAAEAVTELESMATACAQRKSYEEAIRYLKKVLIIDRGRAGVLKRIESLGRARDRNKRIALQVSLVTAVLGAIGASIWGWMDYTEGRKNRLAAMNREITAGMAPGRDLMAAAKAALEQSVESLGAWQTSEPPAVIAAAEAAAKAIGELEAARTMNAAAADGLWEKYRSDLDPDFASSRKRADEQVVEEARARVARALQNIGDALHREFEKVLEEAVTGGRPTSTLGALRTIRVLAAGLGSLPEARLRAGRLVEEARKLEAQAAARIATIEGYERMVRSAQAEADAAWGRGELTAARDLIADLLARYDTAEFYDTLALRVRIATTPRTATVELLRGLDAGGGPVPAHPGPLDFRYTAAQGLRIRVTARGFETQEREIRPIESSAPRTSEALRAAFPAMLRIDLQKQAVWTISLGTAAVSAPPVALPDGNTLIADRSGHLRVVNTATGAEVAAWNSQSPAGIIGEPVVHRGMVFGATFDGVVFGRSLADLSRGWRIAPGDERSPGPVESTPAVDGDVLVVAGAGGTVVALRTDTGEAIWRKYLEELPQGQGPRVPLLVVRGQVVCVTETGELYCLRLTDGRTTVVVPSASAAARNLPAPVGPAVASPATGKVLVPIRGEDRDFVLVQIPEISAGAAAPRVATYDWFHGADGAAAAGAAFLPGPPDGGRVVLAYGDGRVLMVPLYPLSPPPALDRAGIRLLEPGERLLYAPVAVPGGFVVPAAGRLSAVALEGTSLRILWTWALPAGEHMAAPPVHVGDHVLVATSPSGSVHALLLAE